MVALPSNQEEQPLKLTRRCRTAPDASAPLAREPVQQEEGGRAEADHPMQRGDDRAHLVASRIVEQIAGERQEQQEAQQSNAAPAPPPRPPAIQDMRGPQQPQRPEGGE